MATFEKRLGRDGSVSWRAKVRVRGYEPQTATFKRKTDAERWAQRTEADIRDDKYFPSAKARKHTVADLIDEYLSHLKLRKPTRHRDVKPLLEWWKAEIGHTVLSHFRSGQVLAAQKKLLERKKQRKEADGKLLTLSPGTVNRYMVALQTAVNFGIRQLKWISDNPVKEVDKLEEPQGRTRFLSEDEIKRLLAACKASKNPHLFAVVVIGIATGARRKEIQFMKWSDVNPECTLATLPKTKNGEVRSIYLTGIASEIVKDKLNRKTPEQIYLFPSPNDPNRPIDFQSAWYYALDVAQIKDFHFHDLRHTCGSYLAMNGASLLEIADALGHKTLQMVKRYAHLTTSHTSGVVGNMTEKVLGRVEI